MSKRIQPRKLGSARLAALMSLGVVAATSACGSGEADTQTDTDDQREFRFAHVQPESHYTSTAVLQMGEEVEEQMGHTLDLYAGGALGGDDEVISSLRSGDVDFMWSSTGQLAREVPELNLFSAMYLIEGREHFQEIADPDSAAYEQVKSLIEESIPGVRMIGIMGGTERNLYIGGNAVETPADLQGRSIRVQDSPVTTEAWRNLGADPVSLPWNEIYTALQSGVIEGAESSTDSYYNNNFYEVADNLILTGHEFAVLPMLMSEQTFSELPEEEQDSILDISSSAAQHSWEEGWSTVEEFEETTLTEEGVNIVDPDLTQFREGAEEYHEEVAAEYDANELLETIRR